MIEIPQWLHELALEDMPEQHRKLAELMGMEGMLNFLQRYAGTYYYVPKLDEIIRVARNKSLVRDYMAGVDPKDLSHKYDLSVVQVYAIISQDKHAADRDQYSLFDGENEKAI